MSVHTLLVMYSLQVNIILMMGDAVLQMLAVTAPAPGRSLAMSLVWAHCRNLS